MATLRAWVGITNELITFLPDPEQSFAANGVKLCELGKVKGRGVRWWLVAFEPTMPAPAGFHFADGDMLPITFSLSPDRGGTPYVTGPGYSTPWTTW